MRSREADQGTRKGKKMTDEGVGDGLIKVSDLIIEHPEVRSFEVKITLDASL